MHLKMQSMKNRKGASELKNNSDERLLQIEGLKKYFTKSSGIIKRKTDYIKAVDDVSFFLNKEKPLDWLVKAGAANQLQEEP